MEKDKQLENKQRISGWYENYIEALDVAIRKDDITLEELLSITLDKGILNHYVPEDTELLEERIKDNKFVWEKGRNDPELYERLFYSAECSRGNIGMSADSSIINVIYIILRKISEIASDKRNNILGTEEIVDDARIEIERLLETFQKIIKEKYKELKGERELIIFPIGTRAVFYGISLTVEGYSFDGCMIVSADTEEGQTSLFKYVKGNKSWGIPPKDFLSDNFRIIQ